MNRFGDSNYDLKRLLSVHSFLALIPSYGYAPAYNLPIALYGLYAYEQHDSTFHIKHFTYLHAISILCDIFYLIGWSELLSTPRWILLPLLIINLVLKPITLLSAFQALRLRGDEFRFGSLGPNSLPGWVNSQNAHHDNNGINSGGGAYQSLGGDLESNEEPPAFSITENAQSASKSKSTDQYKVIE